MKTTERECCRNKEEEVQSPRVGRVEEWRKASWQEARS